MANIKAWIDRYLALARDVVTEEVARAEWAKGRAMMLEEALAYVRTEAGPAE